MHAKKIMLLFGKNEKESVMKYSEANEYDLVFPFLMAQKALLVIVTRGEREGCITCTQ